MLNHCKNGHALTPDNVYTRPILRTRPNASRECKICRKASQHRWAKSGALGETVTRRVMFALDDGWTINRIAGRYGGKYVPGMKIVDPGRLRLFCMAQPKLGKIILAKAKTNRVAIWRASIQSKHPTIAAPAIIRATDDMDVIEAAVSLHLPRDLRQDVVQNMWVAVRERRLKRSDIAARAHEYVSAEYKANHNAWGPRSLDVPIWLDSNTTLLDTLSRGMWD
jgi:hypothetical protein